MKIYRSQNVVDAAKERIHWLFDEFPNIICNVSGGKDSAVVFDLCLQEAKDRNRLPLTVMWIDQEAEWQATVDQIKLWMYRDDVLPRWFQMPIKLFNATSVSDHWLYCWRQEDKDRWVHPQVDISIKDNIYGTDRFAKLFKAIIDHDYKDQKACYIAGVRTEESPNRFMGLTHYPCYKWVTWGSALNKKQEHYTFYPIYDWGYSDVWKYIHENKLPYNRIYDAQYRYGLPIGNMRVSNVHHETAVWNLFYLQEVEPQTYERIVSRLQGIDMAGKLGKEDYFINDLPFMFNTWREYRDYLLEHLIKDNSWRRRFNVWFNRFDKKFGRDNIPISVWKGMVNSILCNDWEGVKLNNLLPSPAVRKERRLIC